MMLPSGESPPPNMVFIYSKAESTISSVMTNGSSSGIAFRYTSSSGLPKSPCLSEKNDKPKRDETPIPFR